MDKDKARQWISELRSGKYVQGKKRLKWGGRYCCLGVADEAVMDRMTLSMDFRAGNLLGEERNILGIDRKISEEEAAKYGIDVGYIHDVLQMANDVLGWDFLKIADFLEDVLELGAQYKMHKWLDALENGNYKQTRGELGNVESGMCCMGVANHVVYNDYTHEYKPYLNPVHEEELGLEKLITEEEVDFYNVLATLQEKYYRMVIEGEPARKNMLANLNDELEYNFRQVATVIRHLGWDKV